MEKTRKNFIEVIKDSGIILLLVISNIILITSILYFFHIEITKWHLPIIYVIANFEFIVLLRKNKKIINMIISSFLSIIIIGASIIFSGNIYDLSVDGNSYHKLAIGSLKNGWNPVYEENENFNKEQGNVIDIEKSNATLWTDHYTKGTWIFSAVVYAFTGNIEAGKCITILLMYICFSLIMSYLSSKMNLIYAIIIALITAINPISIAQSINYYIDGDLGLSLFIIIYALIAITDETFKNIKFESFVILASSLILCINIKFTGLAFAGIFCFLFYIYWLYNSKKQGTKQFKKDIVVYTLFYAIVVIVSTCIVGYSSYVRNTIEHGHPFYPLYGEGSKDIITTMQPNYFSERNVIQKILISWFSKGENVTYSYETDGIKPKLKVPFTWSEEELKNYVIPDIRIGGFGPLFSGIIIISIAVTIYGILSLIKNKKKNIYIPYLLLLLGITILMLIVDGSWWARYTPYVYMVPIVALSYLLVDKKNIVKNVIGYILAILLICNSIMILNSTYENYKENGTYLENRIEAFREECEKNGCVKIKLKHKDSQGPLYNLNDKNLNYQEDDSIEEKEDGYMFVY